MKSKFLPHIFLLGILIVCSLQVAAQSVAREWNEALIQAIRRDFARPTVHARNLFHISMGMYDGWAAYSDKARPYFLGNTLGTYTCVYNGVPVPPNTKAAQEEAISYAAYRLIKHRFQTSPGAAATNAAIDNLMATLGYDISFTSVDYSTGNPAALGNYIAQEIIAFGLTDGSNEQGGYANLFYTPANAPLIVANTGNTTMTDPNRWQPLALTVIIDQNGNVLPGTTPKFLSAEWGRVVPFALKNADKTTFTRNGNNYYVYHDPGAPPTMDTATGLGTTAEYIWNHTLVANWASHLTPLDTTLWDISPATVGNTGALPTNFAEYQNFYDTENGGVIQSGRTVNPKTGLPYTPQIVKRGDFTRVLAEFWADGPSSETPPGHWFTILNYVSDHPQFVKKWRGAGPVLEDLEWDVRSYFALGGAMHDAAVTCWGIKGWYDYTRPLSAIRYMAERGQSTETLAPDYSPLGLPLNTGFVERVQIGDPLAGTNNEFVGEIKIKSWKGPNFVANPVTDIAGVEWILAKNWWPFQKGTFVTPPFAGYISGHSTYSRTAAELMTLMTGDEYFPGGMGEFHAPQSAYLTLEDGPSQDIYLQWATYRDASDQCSLSRIWGGIHPPCDDIPGRNIGKIIGPESFVYAEQCMDRNGKPDITSLTISKDTLTDADNGTTTFCITIAYEKGMDTLVAPAISFPNENPLLNSLVLNTATSKWINDYTYSACYDLLPSSHEVLDNIDVMVSNAQDRLSIAQLPFVVSDTFSINTDAPDVVSAIPNFNLLTDSCIGAAAFYITFTFDQAADTTFSPTITFPNENPLANTLVLNTAQSSWLDSTTYVVYYDVLDANEIIDSIDFNVAGVVNSLGNNQLTFYDENAFRINTLNGILPIDLALFTAKAEDCHVDLFFMTMSEHNNVRFEILRSEDAIHWQILTTLAGTGNSQTAKQYQYRDKTPSRVNHYCLRQIDTDGNANYFNATGSQTVKSNCFDGTTKGITEIFPNPANSSTINVKYYTDKLNEPLSVQIIDLYGRTLQTNNILPDQRANILSVNIKHLPVGTYYIQLSSNSWHSKAVKFVVLQP